VIDLAEARADPRAYDGMMLPPWLIDNAKAWAVIRWPGPPGCWALWCWHRQGPKLN
jgi:hypothetical protein